MRNLWLFLGLALKSGLGAEGRSEREKTPGVPPFKAFTSSLSATATATLAKINSSAAEV
jgi:hypothetical protein